MKEFEIDAVIETFIKYTTTYIVNKICIGQLNKSSKLSHKFMNVAEEITSLRNPSALQLAPNLYLRCAHNKNEQKISFNLKATPDLFVYTLETFKTRLVKKHTENLYGTDAKTNVIKHADNIINFLQDFVEYSNSKFSYAYLIHNTSILLKNPQMIFHIPDRVFNDIMDSIKTMMKNPSDNIMDMHNKILEYRNDLIYLQPNFKLTPKMQKYIDQLSALDFKLELLG